MRILLFFLSSVFSASGTSDSGNLTRFQADFLKEVNLVRSRGCNCGTTYMAPVPPLSWNIFLASSAESHARDMAKKKYFNHVSRSGKSSKDRMENAGYSLTGMRIYAVGENIAAGQPTVKEVMKSWLKSEGHCKNIMSKVYREIGIAEYNRYWVQDFGMRVAR